MIRMFAMMIVFSSVLMACSGQEEELPENSSNQENVGQESEKLELFTTIYPLEDFARKIGGELVNVTNIVPVGSDAHTFEPTARQMIDVVEGDVFIYNGAGLEGFADAVIDTVKEESVLVVQASKDIQLLDFEEYPTEEEHEDNKNEEEHATEEEHADHTNEENHATEAEDAHGHDADPHVWLDPILSIKLAENIKDALIQLMPEEEEYFTLNFEEVKAELENINAEFEKMAHEANKDTFLVSHSGYGYWERYGIYQRGIAGVVSTSEPSQRELEEIIQFATEHQLTYVLFEQNITSKVAEIVKNEVGADVLYLHNLEALTKEDLENGEDYFSLMRRNIKALQSALQ